MVVMHVRRWRMGVIGPSTTHFRVFAVLVWVLIGMVDVHLFELKHS